MAKVFSLTALGEEMLSAETKISEERKIDEDSLFDGYTETKDLDAKYGIDGNYKFCEKTINVYSRTIFNTTSQKDEKITVMEIKKRYEVAEEFVEETQVDFIIKSYPLKPDPNRKKATKIITIRFFISGTGEIYTGKIFSQEIGFAYGKDDKIEAQKEESLQCEFKLNGTTLENLKDKKVVCFLRKEEVFILEIIVKVNGNSDSDFPKILADDIINRKNQVLAMFNLAPISASAKVLSKMKDVISAIFDLSDASGISNLSDEKLEDYLKTRGIEIYYSVYQIAGRISNNHKKYLRNFSDYVQ